MISSTHIVKCDPTPSTYWKAMFYWTEDFLAKSILEQWILYPKIIESIKSLAEENGWGDRWTIVHPQEVPLYVESFNPNFDCAAGAAAAASEIAAVLGIQAKF